MGDDPADRYADWRSLLDLALEIETNLQIAYTSSSRAGGEARLLRACRARNRGRIEVRGLPTEMIGDHGALIAGMIGDDLPR